MNVTGIYMDRFLHDVDTVVNLKNAQPKCWELCFIQ